MSVVDAFLNCVSCIPQSLKNDMLGNVVVTGGSSLFEGFGERFHSEVQSNLSENIKTVHVTDKSFYLNTLNQFVSSSHYETHQISKKIYEEYGSVSLIKMLNI